MGGDPIQDNIPYLIPGFHGVREAVTQGQVKIKELWIAQGKKSARTEEVLQIAGERKIPVHFKKGSELSHLLPGIAHQGIVALAAKFVYADLNRMVDMSLQGHPRALLVAADHITDEGNLGSLIRTAAFFGAHGMIIPKKRSASVSTRVLKRSSGAYVYLPIARVVNLGRFLDLSKEKGFWVIGTSGESSDSIYQFDWDRDLIIVLGNEQKGLSRSVEKRCHQVVGVPALGHMGSLNVAVAGGVIFSEVIRQRIALQGSD
jgi:23S rRNA (guanosine2251-2'-O)-methyltransferase